MGALAKLAGRGLVWADCEALERRHRLGRETLVVLDFIIEAAAPTYEQSIRSRNRGGRFARNSVKKRIQTKSWLVIIEGFLGFYKMVPPPMLTEFLHDKADVFDSKAEAAAD